MGNKFNKVFPSFDSFNKKFAPGSQLINIFSSQFSFHLSSKQSDNKFKTHIHLLDNISLKSSLDLSYTLIVSDANIKNHVATSILHIHTHNKPVIKTLYYAVNITTIEAKLFAFRYSINQATNLNSINKIIVITNSIHTTKKIFNPSSHPFQIHVASISDELKNFFVKNHDKCSSYCEWPLYKFVDKETKKFCPKPYYSCKSSWDFSKKSKCNDILMRWKMIFQASDEKGH